MEALVLRLVLVLKKDATGRDRTLNLSFLPFDDDLNQINPLQFYSILPINFNGDREDVNNLILKLNQFSAIGGFSINNNNEIILRYIHCIPRFEIYQKESLEEVINLFVKNMDVLGSKIESCINGNLSSEEIMSNFI